MRNKEYIPIANANVNQHLKDGIKTDWFIRENITGKELGILPSKLNEKEVFGILNTIRKYEIEAFNKGIIFGKEKSNKILSPQIAQLKEMNRLASIENERLADALDKEQKK